MSDLPYMAEILLVSFNFPPKGWAFCDGQLLPINQNQALFSLLGTTYGGDGVRTFALPNLRGRVPLHVGAGFVLGEVGGEDAHTLVATEMPAHNHLVGASSNNADQKGAAGNYPASNSGRFPYGTTSDVPLAATAVTKVGGSQPHENRSPFLVLNYVIALQGVYPDRN